MPQFMCCDLILKRHGLVTTAFACCRKRLAFRDAGDDHGLIEP
jgi:hypothetical protein